MPLVGGHLDPAEHVTLRRASSAGSELAGGCGREETPAEVEMVADLRRLGGVVPRVGPAAVLGANRLASLARVLP